MSRRRAKRPHRDTTDQPGLPLADSSRRRGSVPEPEAAAKLAIARRAKPSPVPDRVRLLLTLELRRELAEKLSLKAIRSERNIEAGRVWVICDGCGVAVTVPLHPQPAMLREESE